jgi:site-specific DNA recombinase
MPVADLYARVSTKIQKEEGTSLQSQIKACRALAEKQGYSIGEVFQEDWPGSELERPLLEQLRARVREKRIQAVVIYHPDRLARSPILQAIVELEAAKNGVQYFYVTEPADTTPEGQLVRYVKGYAAQIERLQIRERTMRGRKERALKGKLTTGGMDLYGYDYDKKTGTRTINPAEGDIVRMIFRLLVDEDYTLGRIALKLTEMGIPTKRVRRNQWGRSTVARLLNNPAYTGKVYAHQYMAVLPEKELNPNRRYKLSGRRLRPQEEWIPLEGNTPPIISEEVFAQAQVVLKRHTTKASRNSVNKYLFTGHIKCGICGRTYRGAVAKGTRYYRCLGRDRVVTIETCPSVSYRADDLERMVWDKIKEALLNPDVILSEFEKQQDGEDTSGTLELLSNIESRLSKVAERQQRLVRLYTLGTIDDATIEAESKALKKEQESLEAEKNRLQEKVAQTVLISEWRDTVQAYCERVAENIDQFTIEDQKETLDALQVRLTVYEDRISVDGLLPIGSIGSTQSKSCGTSGTPSFSPSTQS